MELKEISGKEPFPVDLLTCIVLAAATVLLTLTPLESPALRIPLGLAMVLIVPGYALIAALFPRRTDLDSIERIALSFGLSIAVVPLIGLGLNYTPWGIRLTPVVISLAIFTVSMASSPEWTGTGSQLLSLEEPGPVLPRQFARRFAC